jgi:hypothetical protein
LAIFVLFLFEFLFFAQAARAHTFFFDKKVCKKSSQPEPRLLFMDKTVSRLTAG